MAHGEAHVAHHIPSPLVRLRHLGAGHGADDRIGPVADGNAQGGGDFISVTVGRGKARLEQTVCTPLIQRLVRGEDVVTVLIQRQREDVLAVDGAADAVAADMVMTTGWPPLVSLQAGLAGIECDVDQRIVPRR